MEASILAPLNVDFLDVAGALGGTRSPAFLGQMTIKSVYLFATQLSMYISHPTNAPVQTSTISSPSSLPALNFHQTRLRVVSRSHTSLRLTPALQLCNPPRAEQKVQGQSRLEFYFPLPCRIPRHDANADFLTCPFPTPVLGRSFLTTNASEVR